MKVFIVGATGVIGRALIPMLLEKGDDVVALVRSLDRAKSIALPGVQLVEGDLLEVEPDALHSLLEGCDVAAHMATALRAGSPGLGTTNTNALLRGAGTRKLLDASVAAGVDRYMQQGLAIAYVDGGEEWQDESTLFFIAEGATAASQPAIEMEEMVRAIDPATMGWVILRGGAFVGADTRQDQHIADLRSGSWKVPGDGRNWVSYIGVEDYAAAVAAAIHSSVRGAIFNITDDPMRSGDYYDHLADLLGVSRPERDTSVAQPRSSRCTHAATTEALGWQPTRGIWPIV